MTYAYALSAHKLQGSELDAILLYQDYCSENWSSARWFYTALTRAVSKVYLINTKYQTLI
jgi:exodeoxyribonuclease-5